MEMVILEARDSQLLASADVPSDERGPADDIQNETQNHDCDFLPNRRTRRPGEARDERNELERGKLGNETETRQRSE